MTLPSPASFLDIALAAFPPEAQAVASEAAAEVAPLLVKPGPQDTSGATSLRVGGATVRIPYNLYLGKAAREVAPPAGPVGLAVHCLLTRGDDGFTRQAALAGLLGAREAWVVPYVMLLAGEYVVEIIADMVAALPRLDREAYGGFARENPATMELLRARATSYWNEYHRRGGHHRDRWADRNDYPGLVFLAQVQAWADEKTSP